MVSFCFFMLCREEFKRHKKAEAKFLTSFFAEWENYVDTLEQQDTLEKVGKNLDSGTVETMSTEQKQQLAKLLMEVEQGGAAAGPSSTQG